MTTKEIIRQIAKEKGVSPEQVEADMMEAIRAGMASTDSRAQELWKRISPDGKESSLDDFLKFCANEVNKRMGS